jgi:hypothetical protein
VRAERPSPRQLREDQGLPGEFLVAFTERLLDRRAQLLRRGESPEGARDRAVAEAVQAFTAGAAAREWTVGERRIAQLADDTLGLEDEFRDQHGYAPELARRYAVGEVLDGERARHELSAWLLPPPGPPERPDPAHAQRERSERTGPDGLTDSVRTREAGRER